MQSYTYDPAVGLLFTIVSSHCSDHYIVNFSAMTAGANLYELMTGSELEMFSCFPIRKIAGKQARKKFSTLDI